MTITQYVTYLGLYRFAHISNMYNIEDRRFPEHASTRMALNV